MHELLIKLMELKAEAIASTTGLPASTYFREADKKAIRRWPLEDVRRIVKCLNERIPDYPNYLSTSCPFCIRYLDDCSSCEYGKEHGLCNDDDSDFRLVLSRLRRPIDTVAIWEKAKAWWQTLRAYHQSANSTKTPEDFFVPSVLATSSLRKTLLMHLLINKLTSYRLA